MTAGYPGSDRLHTCLRDGAVAHTTSPTRWPAGQDKDPLILTNGLVVTRDRAFLGTVEVMKPYIVAVYRGLTTLPGAIDLSGDYLLPGLVELHTCNLLRHLPTHPDVRPSVLSAVMTHDDEMIRAGITTAFDGLSPARAEGTTHDQITDELATVIRHAAQGGLTRSDHRLGLDFVADGDAAALLLSAYQTGSGEVGEPGAPCSQAMFPSITSVETRATSPTIIKTSRQAVCGFPRTVAMAQAARAARFKVMLAAPCLIGESAKGVPLPDNLESASRMVAEKLVDILSSDDYPPSLLQGAFRLRQSPSRMTLSEAIATVSSTPAQVAGLTDRGEIAPGKRADLIRVYFGEARPVMREVWRAGVRVY